MANAQQVRQDSTRHVNPVKHGTPQLTTITIDSTAEDARNTGEENILSPGLALGIITAQDTYTGYDPNGSDGTEVARFVLYDEVDTKSGDPSASAADVPATVIWFGNLDSAKVFDEDGTAIATSGKADLAKGGDGDSTILWD